MFLSSTELGTLVSFLNLQDSDIILVRAAPKHNLHAELIVRKSHRKHKFLTTIHEQFSKTQRAGVF